MADMLDVLDREKGLALAETLTEAGERIFGDAPRTHPWDVDDRARPDDLAAILAKCASPPEPGGRYVMA
ncbi:hypothetical protein ACFWPQ_40850 [Streptomyces sp. NPDC058464]|uniref:hypothetical protein n=1 Tax=Streptomyces sp. NPDC058464 TaxID=3346511 RepID=UPI0036476F19